MRLGRDRTDDSGRTVPPRGGHVGRLAMPRSRGAASGTLLVLLGVWGALIPMVGPYFDFAFTPDDAWNMTEGRFWLSLLPGAAVVLRGALLLAAANRASATLAAQIALAGGIWFAIGPTMSRLWNDGEVLLGAALGGTTQQVVERLAYFEGLGVLIAALASIALGRVTTRSVHDVERLERDAMPARDRDATAIRDRDRDVEPVAARDADTGRYSDRERQPEPAGKPRTESPAEPELIPRHEAGLTGQGTAEPEHESGLRRFGRRARTSR